MTPTRLLTLFVTLLIATGGCARVQPHVSLPEVTLGEPSFYPTLEAYAGAPIVGGNAVEILLNGEQIFPALLEAIRTAQRTITYAQYYYEEGPVARDVAEALAERCRAGVGVNVLLDAFGSISIPVGYLDLMRVSGCHVVWFRPLSQYVFRTYYKRNHRRILVVDGRVGFTGGAGVSRKWMGNGRTENHWRDTDVRVEGPVVEYLQAAFVENWLEATGMVLGGEAYFPRPIEPRGQVYAQVGAQLAHRRQHRDVHDAAAGAVRRPALGARSPTPTSSSTTACETPCCGRSAVACGWWCWCPASSTTTWCARPAEPSSATSCGPAWKSTSTRRPCCTPRRW